MIRIVLALAAACSALVATVASAQSISPVEPLAKAPATLASDRAYILYRTNRFKTGILVVSPVFVRVPDAEEIEAYHVAKKAAFDAALPKLQTDFEKSRDKSGGTEPPSLDTFAFAYDGPPNAFGVKGGTSLSDTGPYRTYLISVRPGTYILYGAARGSAGIDTCFCLGTVAFDAAAGAIVDLGALMMDKVFDRSSVPELEEESGFGHPPNGAPSPLGLGIRQSTDAMSRPPELGALPVAPARLRAVGAYLEAGAGAVNRVPPVSGALAYSHGRVIDARTGALVPPGVIAP